MNEKRSPNLEFWRKRSRLQNVTDEPLLMATGSELGNSDAGYTHYSWLYSSS